MDPQERQRLIEQFVALRQAWMAKCFNSGAHIISKDCSYICRAEGQILARLDLRGQVELHRALKIDWPEGEARLLAAELESQ